MKQFLVYIVVALFLIACNSTEPKGDLDAAVVTNMNSADSLTPKTAPVFKFETDTHNFGKLTQGEKVAFTFKFTNIGKTDLLIDDAITSCGCTVPKYSKDPVKPGQQGEVEVVFNTTGKKGMQYKSVQLFANTIPNVKELKIRALVEEAK